MFGMTVNDVSGKAIANLATDELSHPNPVFHGDTLFVESEVLEVRPSESKPDRGVVRVHTRAYNQDGTLVAEFKRAVLVPAQEPRIRRRHGQLQTAHRPGEEDRQQARRNRRPQGGRRASSRTSPAGKGSLKDKAKAAGEAIKDPGAPGEENKPEGP